jgi:two-component system sensor histidine kinase KdpD
VVFVAEGYTGVLMVGRDEVRRELESADRLKHELVSMVSHDLKTPLTIIQACTVEMLEAGWLEEHQYRRFLEMILQNTERLARLISAIVDVSRIESRALDLTPGPLDVASVTRRIVEGMSPIAPVRLDIAPQLPEVHADRDAVERILVNLIDNAVRFSPPGEKVTVQVVATDEAGFVELRVIDGGPGIPPDRRDGLFSKFYQVDPSPSGRRSGSGLGLAIVRGLAEAMGGRAGYRPGEPTGSIFWARIPVEAA